LLLDTSKMLQTTLRLRMLAYSCLLISAAVELVISSTVLGWSLKVYRGGYIKSNPQLVGCSAITLLLFSLCFLPGLRSRVPIWSELSMVAIMFTLWSVSLSRLYVATPGLLSGCGGFLICKGWIAMLVFAWGACGSLCCSFLFLLVSSSLAHIKRHDPSVWCTSAAHYDWRQREWLNRMSLRHIGSQQASPTLSSGEREMNEKQADGHYAMERQFTID